MPQDINLEELMNEFEEEYVEEELSVEDDFSDDEIEVETSDDEVETEVETPVPTEEEKRNAAFAELRRKADEGEKFRGFVEQLATAGGTSPEEIMQRFQERQLEEQATEQNVPVEFLKRLQTLELENATNKQQSIAQKFNTDVEALLGEGAADEDIRHALEHAAKAGIDIRQGTVDFKEVYRLAHLDKVIEQEVEKSRQKDLENKRKRQEQASLAHGTSESSSSDDLTDDAIDKELARMGLRI